MLPIVNPAAAGRRPRPIAARSPLRLVALLAVVAAMPGCGRLGNHPLAAAAREEVSRNSRVIELTGGPVEFGSSVTGRSNETDGLAALQFEARGPKSTAVVVVEGKKLGGEWGVTLLEVRPRAGEPLRLTADLEARTGVDTPKFDPAATPSVPATPAAPPPAEIEIPLPPGGPGR